MLYTHAAASTSQTALTCSPRLSASIPKEIAPIIATRLQTSLEGSVDFACIVSILNLSINNYSIFILLCTVSLNPCDSTPPFSFFLLYFRIKKGMIYIIPSIIVYFLTIMHALNNRQYEYLHERYLLAEQITEHEQPHLFQA